MNPNYDDLTSRISEAPSWWQEGGVPRWGEFSPRQASSIYAREVVLMEIACQSCGTPFRVAICNAGWKQKEPLSDQIVSGNLHYGDPPNTGCCASGASMNSEPCQILEYWFNQDPQYTKDGVVTDYESYFAWSRNPLLEGAYDGWAGNTRPLGAQTKP